MWRVCFGPSILSGSEESFDCAPQAVSRSSYKVARTVFEFGPAVWVSCEKHGRGDIRHCWMNRALPLAIVRKTNRQKLCAIGSLLRGSNTREESKTPNSGISACEKAHSCFAHAVMLAQVVLRIAVIGTPTSGCMVHSSHRPVPTVLVAFHVHTSRWVRGMSLVTRRIALG